jgi:hypothetical protein
MLLKITGDASGKAYWFIVFGVPQAVVLFQTLILAIFYRF